LPKINQNTTQMVQKTYYKTKDYCKVKFTFNVENAETVEILGLNSDWENSVIMSKKKDGSFTADVSLPKNTEHQFKYRVNENEWLNEPEADKEVANEFGGINSVIVL
jgi:hypothetical protein